MRREVICGDALDTADFCPRCGGLLLICGYEYLLMCSDCGRHWTPRVTKPVKVPAFDAEPGGIGEGAL